jgi:hypothetical protein
MLQLHTLGAHTASREARWLRKLCRQNTFHHFKLRAFSWRKRLLDHRKTGNLPNDWELS